MSATIEMFETGRRALKANPLVLDAFIVKMSAAAREPARMFRDLILSDEQDLATIHDISQAIKVGLSADVLKELEAFKHEVARMIFLPAAPA